MNDEQRRTLDLMSPEVEEALEKTLAALEVCGKILKNLVEVKGEVQAKPALGQCRLAWKAVNEVLNG